MKYVILLIFCEKLINCSYFTEHDIHFAVNDTNLTIIEKLDNSLARLLNIPNVDVSEETKFWNHSIWNNQTILKLATYIAGESKEEDSEEADDYEEEEEERKEEEKKLKDHKSKQKLATKYDLVNCTTLSTKKLSNKFAEEDVKVELKLNITMMKILLHEKIFNIETKKIRRLMKNVSLNEIIKHLKTLKHCFMLARDDKKGGYDEYLRNSSQLLFDKGGPAFIRVGIHNLLDEYTERQLFNGRDINIISELFDDAFNAWYELRRHILYEEKEQQDKVKYP